MTCIGRVIFLGAFWTMTIYLVADEKTMIPSRKMRACKGMVEWLQWYALHLRIGRKEM